jgi:hypothetical protein
MTAHTPWTIDLNDGGWDILPSPSLPPPEPGPDAIATVYTSEHAARIVACVNACAGINPEAVPDLLTALQSALPALEWGLVHDAGNFQQFNECADTARAALAKAKLS